MITVDETLHEEDYLRVFKRLGRFFIRYDAGAHQIAIREDEISEAEARVAAASSEGATTVLLALQRRLLERGVDAYRPNT